MRESSDIHGIIFDLDGTVYESAGFAATIQNAAVEYIAEILMIEPATACEKITETRSRLTAEHNEIPTLSAVCSELGGNIRDLHALFEVYLQPEVYLSRDQRVISLMETLSAKLPLHIYTNNNRIMTVRILEHLGLSSFFQRIYAIDDSWVAKPDNGTLERILAETNLSPSQALFVGDRYDIDLRLPEQHGCPVYLSQSIEQLLRLGELLND
jgi:putative hydrolase of the HAD superfamily